MVEVKSGQRYCHFKGNSYRVLLIAKDSKTLKKVVVYEDLNNKKVWVRDYDEFISAVDKKKYPNVKQNLRFQNISI